MNTTNSGCKKQNEEADNGSPRHGYVTGIIKNKSNVPVSGVKVIIDHSIFFNSNISTTTSKDGKYKIKIPNGSWHAFAQHRVEYNGRVYTLYLHPDNASGFGGEGAVRNFEWRLTGEMPQPLSGTYGGLVTVDNRPGVYIDETRITYTFTPVAPLIDGSTGAVLTLRSVDGGNLKDVPIGRYHVTATYEGKALKFRKWNTEDVFVKTYELNFEPQIPAQCDNCVKLEYDLES